MAIRPGFGARIPILSIGIAVALLSRSADSHHSFTIYDRENPVTLRGEVAEFVWVNPHSWLYLDVVSQDGSTTQWQLELAPVNMLSRQGWERTTLEPGDMISVDAHPLHSGEPGARFIDFSFIEQDRLSPRNMPSFRRAERPQPVPMSDAEARNFNGIWLNGDGGIHFDTAATSVGRDQQPPLRPTYMAQWRERFAQQDAGRSTVDPTAECAPPGFPRFLNMVLPGEIVQSEHQLNWYAEWGEATVRVILDDRAMPQTLDPSYNGYTTGRWEGNTLVTRTIALRGDTLVDTTGIPHSDELTVDMRMTKLTPDFIEVEVTLNDSVVFFEPWSTVKQYVRAPADYYIREYACFDGNRYERSADGSIEVILD